ncbi:hypothetical protein AX17_005811 [Amanita inopinata Kibby_2008]|nr:hypothetical protein AX17_005811 [Amanita inopinata Kibby_2008]
MPEQLQDESSVPPLYQPKPEDWLQRAHETADLGYAGFFPPRPGQEEDMLSIKTVKYGFATESRVSAESFSAKAMVNEGLHSDEIFAKLDELMNELFARRAERLPPVPASTFRLPTRVTLNEAKRQAWFRDLANPNVPLHKLGKSVPHGAKGHDLLDLLHLNNVAIPRAVWFLRVFGANETAGLRNKPSYNPTQYSVDWANVMTGYMKKQLLDIALPSAPRPGLNIKQTFKGVLTDGDARERWILRFSYCLQLLRIFYAEGMVDKRTFLVWLVQQVATCNLAQAGFVARLAEEYSIDINESRALARSFVDACLNKLSEIRSNGPAQACLNGTELLIISLLQRVCLSTTDAFISPRMWAVHSALLSDVLTGSVTNLTNGQHVEQSNTTIQRQLLDHLSDIKIRNEAMLLSDVPALTPAHLGSAMSDVKLLNSISDKTDLKTLSFFDCGTDDKTIPAAKIDILFTWSTTALQYGEHRPFAAVTLINIWKERLSERASRRNLISPQNFLQDQLFDWLDTSAAAGNKESTNAVALLYGLLMERELFCYTTYIQRLVARGEPGLSFTEEDASRHRSYLRRIPLLDSNPSLINQRKVLLYGVRARETPEEINERQIRKEIRSVLPLLFRGAGESNIISFDALLSSSGTLAAASCFEQVRTVKQWLSPILLNYMAGHQIDVDFSGPVQVYSSSVELMGLAKCFDCILDVSLTALRNPVSTEVVMAIVDVLYRYADIWQCMNAMRDVVLELDTAYQILKGRGQQSRLPYDLLALDAGRYLSAGTRDRINYDIVQFTTALQPPTSHPHPVPEVLPEILCLAANSDPDAPLRLANSLWIKYRTSPEWARRVWDNAIVSLRHIANHELSAEEKRSHILQCGTFLRHVDQYLPTGLDEEVLKWFNDHGRSQSQFSSFNTGTWDILSSILFYLVLYRALRITTVLRGLVFPAWQQGASMESELHPEEFMMNYIRTANNICESLLLRRGTYGVGDVTSSCDAPHVQCLESGRRSVYSEPFFSSLVANIPVLISLENNPCIPKDLREQTTQLRLGLCNEERFRQGAYQNLHATRKAFEQLLDFSEANEEDLGRYFLAGLKNILCGTDEGEEPAQWLPPACQTFGPWKLAATSIHLQLTLKQLGRALTHNATKEYATSSLERVSQELFNRHITSEEAYYIGEMTREIDAAVAGKLINSGLGRVVEILRAPTTTKEALVDCLQWASEILRVILYIAGFPNGKTLSLPGFEFSLHEGLLAATYNKCDTISKLITEDSCPTLLRPIVILSRLLQFTLSYRETWSTKARDAGVSLSVVLFRLALQLCGGSDDEVSTYAMLIDTLYYLLDELPCDTKVAFDPFRYYPDITVSDIPINISLHHRKQLLAISLRLSPNASVSDLVATSYDNSGNAVNSTPVIHRPWEWVENIGEPLLNAKEQRNREKKEPPQAEQLIKNAGSLPLEIFGAKITGDRVVAKATEEFDGKMESNLKSFQDGLSVDSLFRRDWRETRVNVDDSLETFTFGVKSRVEHDVEAESGTAAKGYSDNSSKPAKDSPSSSAVSRSSARRPLSAVERRSPSYPSASLITDSAASEIPDSEGDSVGSSKTVANPKRKRTAMTASDDEIEIVEGPVLIASVSRRNKSKIGGRGKGKKR